MRLYGAPWVEPFLSELEEFPEGHDDQVDPFSDAIKFLADGAGAPTEVSVTVIGADDAPRALPPAAPREVPAALAEFVTRVRGAAMPFASEGGWARAHSVLWQLGDAVSLAEFAAMLEIAARAGVLEIRGEGNELEVRV